MGRSRHFGLPRVIVLALGLLVAATAVVVAAGQTVGRDTGQPAAVAGAIGVAVMTTARPAVHACVVLSYPTTQVVLVSTGESVSGGRTPLPPQPRRGHSDRGPPVAW